MLSSSSPKGCFPDGGFYTPVFLLSGRRRNLHAEDAGDAGLLSASGGG